MNREIYRPFVHSPYIFWSEAEQRDLVRSWGRLDAAPTLIDGEPLPTIREMVEADAATFDLIATDPEIIVGEEIVDALP